LKRYGIDLRTDRSLVAPFAVGHLGADWWASLPLRLPRPASCPAIVVAPRRIAGGRVARLLTRTRKPT